MHYLKLAQAHCVRKIVLPRSLHCPQGKKYYSLKSAKDAGYEPRSNPVPSSAGAGQKPEAEARLHV